MDGHYDRDADIAWVRLEGWDAVRVRAEPTEEGIVEHDRDSGRVGGLEFWKASSRVPAGLLDALPAPPERKVIIERQHA